MQYYVPDGVDIESALARCTHLAIGTHPDDVELIGMHGIESCYDSNEHYFAGVVVTNGAGSPRTGEYANVTDEEMVNIRHDEQNTAAKLGRYGIQIQLAYPSSAVKSFDQAIIDDIKSIIERASPSSLYLHNPLDRHASHRAVLQCCLSALRLVAPKHSGGGQRSTQPIKHCYGVEVWRSLDFLPDAFRIALPRGQHKGLSEKLISIFKSQIAGGKRYDLAFAGRGLANATFAESHHVDAAESISLALDLMPLLDDADITLATFVKSVMTQTTTDCLA